MIRAEMYWQRLTLEISGHAGYDEIGKDIVCAGASMLADALAGVLQEAQERGRVKADWKQVGGKLTIRADPNLGALNEIKAYFRMCCKGLKMLHEQYPKNVEIKEVF